MTTFHEKVDFMKNETYSTQSMPATHCEGPALFTNTPDWRGSFRLSALALNPDLRAGGNATACDGEKGQADSTHWIMRDPLLSRMTLALQSDSATLGRWQALDGGVEPACTGLVIIRQLGFENTPEPAGVLDQLRFMARFTLACLSHSKNSQLQTATLIHSYRRRLAKRQSCRSQWPT